MFDTANYAKAILEGARSMPADIREQFGFEAFIHSRLQYVSGGGPQNIEDAERRADRFSFRLKTTFERVFERSEVTVRRIYARNGSEVAGHLTKFAFPPDAINEWRDCQRMFAQFVEDVEAWVLAEWAIQEGAELVYGNIRITSSAVEPETARAPSPATGTSPGNGKPPVDLQNLIDRRDRMVWAALAVGAVLGASFASAGAITHTLLERMSRLESGALENTPTASTTPPIIVQSASSPPVVLRESPSPRECPDCPIIRRVQPD